MAYLNANIPPTYAQIRKEYLYDLKKGHGEVSDCIIFGLSAITGRAIFFLLLWKTVQYFIAYQLARLFKRDLKSIECPEEDLMNYSSGIVFLIILLFIVGIY